LASYERQIHHGPEGSLPYRLFRPLAFAAALPNDSRGIPNPRWPLVLFLHGAGERGDDNESPLVHGTADFAAVARQHRDPCFVVVPQCPGGEVWASIERTHEPTVLAAVPSRPLRMVRELLAELLETLPIDRERVYLTGLSMGGYGAWDLLQRDPHDFAAAILICGGADCHPARLMSLTDKPLWIFHGDQDQVVPVARSREIVAALRAVGGNPRYTEYLDVGHDSWTATYRNPSVLDWLFAHRRDSTHGVPNPKSANTSPGGEELR
jgi:predicted peptidase